MADRVERQVIERTTEEHRELEGELWQLLHRIERVFEGPLIALAFVWLVLIAADFIWGLNSILQSLVTMIWGIFVFDFLLRFTIAPKKLRYLKRNWLTAISLFVPALRVLRFARFVRLVRLARATRGVRLVRAVASFNRSMGALQSSMARRGARYATVLTAIVLFAGAAGMYAFEVGAPGGGGFETYGESLWWTAMLLTTIGSKAWPVTAAGKILCVLLSAYALGILGYIAASLASFFVGREAATPAGPVAGEDAIRELQAEVRALRDAIETRGGSLG